NNAAGITHSGIHTKRASALSGVARHTTSWNHATQSQVHNVHNNLSHSVNPTAANHNLQASNLHTSSVVNNTHHVNAFANQGNTIRNNWTHNGNHNCFHHNWWVGRSFIGFGGF